MIPPFILLILLSKFSLAINAKKLTIRDGILANILKGGCTGNMKVCGSELKNKSINIFVGSQTIISSIFNFFYIASIIL